MRTILLSILLAGAFLAAPAFANPRSLGDTPVCQTAAKDLALPVGPSISQ